jgi:hypothetical protein
VNVNPIEDRPAQPTATSEDAAEAAFGEDDIPF